MAFTNVAGVVNGSQNLFGGFAWQVNSQNIGNNTSNITVVMYGGRKTTTNIYDVNSVPSYIEYDGGNRLTFNTIYDFRNATVNTVYYVDSSNLVFPQGSAYTFDVTHNADGTRSVPIKTYFNGENNPPYLLDITTTATITLPTIARASQPTLDAASKAFGQTFTIYTNKATGSSFTHNLSYVFGSASGSIATGVVDSTTWTPADALAAQIPTANSGSGTIVCDTYNGGTLIGTKTVSFSLTIPGTWRAALTTAHTDFSWVNSPAQLTGYVIQSISTLTLTLPASLNSLVSAYGTTITGYQVRFDTYNSGEVAYSNSAVSKSAGLVTTSGTAYAYYKIKDARGNWSAEIAEQIMGTGLTIYPYSAPSNTGFNVARTTVIEQAAYQMSFAASSINNANTWTYQRKYYNGSSWVNVDASPVTISGYTITSTLTHSLPYLEANVYQVRVTVADKFNSRDYDDTLPTASVPFALTAQGAGAGKIPTNAVYDFEVGTRGLLSDGPIKGVLKTASGTDVETVLQNLVYTGDTVPTGPIINEADTLDGQHGAFYLPTIYYGSGLIFGSTTAGTTYNGYGHVRCVKQGNVYTFKGEGKIATATGLSASSYSTGLSITSIKSICGIASTLTLVDARLNFLNVLKATGALYASNDAQYGYGMSLASADGGQTLHCGRYYDTAGNFGGWDATNAVYAVGNTWIFEFVMIAA